MKALAPVHARALLRLCDRFGEPAFLDAGRRLQDTLVALTPAPSSASSSH